MPDTARTTAQLQTILADNTSGAISPQDLRDFLVSCLNIVETSLQTLAGPLTVTGTCTATTFSGSGAGLTSLNASNATSGTLPDARLSSNVPRKDTANTFTQTQTVSGTVNVGAAAAAGQVVVRNASNTATVTLTGSTGMSHAARCRRRARSVRTDSKSAAGRRPWTPTARSRRRVTSTAWASSARPSASRRR